MKKEVWKGGALLAPLPLAMVSCQHGDSKPNIITVAWTGIVNSAPPKTYVSIQPIRYSHAIIRDSGMFVINLTTRALARTADLCGVKSGRDIDKFAECNLTYESSPNLGCPMICESPVSLECRVSDVLSLGSHDMFLADILSVCVDSAFLDTGGKLRLDKADIISYAHGNYYTLGSFLGKFGYSVEKKKTAAKRRTK